MWHLPLVFRTPAFRCVPGHRPSRSLATANRLIAFKIPLLEAVVLSRRCRRSEILLIFEIQQDIQRKTLLFGVGTALGFEKERSSRSDAMAARPSRQRAVNRHSSGDAGRRF
jgi:hypothetical protein